MIDTRLETFLALCKVMNYRKTAELLNMTQPAVTQHIHYLEEKYGCKLFCYDRRTLTKTREAEVLQTYAENVMYQEKKLREELMYNEGMNLAIGATKTIGEYVMAEHVSAFLEKEGNGLSVMVENTEKLLAELAAGKLDFALVEGFFDRSRYASKLYRKEPFVGLCSVNHPFAHRRIEIDEIWKQTLILREEGSGTRNILEQLLTERNHSFSEFERIVTVSNFGLITKLLEKSGGITFAYRAVGESNDALAEFCVKEWEIFREFNYVYLDTTYSAEAVAVFDLFRQRVD